MKLGAAVAVLALGWCAGACRSERRPKAEAAIPLDIVLKMPPDATALGGADFDRARAAGLDGWLSAAGVNGTKQVYAAWNGHDLTMLEREPGGVVGTVRHSDLLDRSQIAASGSLLWAVGQGSSIPALPGNAANVTRLLKDADWVTLTVRGDSGVHLDITAECPTEETARKIEETARASFTLAAAAEARKPQIAATLRSVKVSRMATLASLHLDTTAEGLQAFARVLH